VWRALATQLGNPSGLLGPVVARGLNKANGRAIEDAVKALGLTGGESVADIGFGGGIGLDLLLDAVGEDGTVHGVEPSSDMLLRARDAHSAQVANGRLELHQTTMDRLPFGDGALGGWISLNTIYFIAELETAFGELRRVTAAAGCGVLGVANPDWLARQPFAAHGFTIRPVDQVVAALAIAGFAVEPRTAPDGPPANGYSLLICR
jgi:ubiquinone/menaquinone biosynthesis C-methylase UbiE